MSKLKEPKTLIESSYLSKGSIGDMGVPGSSIVYYSLVVSPKEGKVSGIVEIVQAVAEPTERVHVTGTIRATSHGEVTQIVSLSGKYLVLAIPPARGSYLEEFTAYLDVDYEWNGTGGFTYGAHKMDNLPVNSSN